MNIHYSHLLSYPRSGNTWVRYIIEHFSGFPTKGIGENSLAQAFNNYDSWKHTLESKYSIEDKTSLSIDVHPKLDVSIDAKPIALKSHGIPQIYDNNHRYRKFGLYPNLIVVVRDYKECLVKQLGALHFNPRITNLGEKSINHYLSIIRYYHDFNGRKIMVYYEDLISNPKLTIKELLEHLGLDINKLESFMLNYDYHKSSSIKLYDRAGKHKKSITRGDHIDFWKNKLGNNAILIDNKIKSINSILFNTYLKRYALNK